MAPGGIHSDSGTSRAASATAFLFHFRPRPTPPDVYAGSSQSEPGTCALPTTTGPPLARGDPSGLAGGVGLRARGCVLRPSGFPLGKPG